MTTHTRNSTEYLYSLQTLGNGKLLVQIIYNQECYSKQLAASFKTLRKRSCDPNSQKLSSIMRYMQETLNKMVLAQILNLENEVVRKGI